MPNAMVFDTAVRDVLEIPGDNERVPIRFFLTQELMPDEATLEQLRLLAGVTGAVSHVAVLPDVHRKSRNISPTGIVLATENALVPRAVDTGISCGMRILLSDIDSDVWTDRRLDALFAEIKRRVPVLFHEEDVLNRDDVAELLLEGGSWVSRKLGIDDRELLNIEDAGTFSTDARTVEDILACIPKKSLKKGRRCFGTLGDGNHFLELQEIVEVLEPELAAALELQEGKTVFMMHTGSRSVGSKMMKHYLQEWEDRLFGNGTSSDRLWTVDPRSDEGMRLARALAAASNFGFANRMAITEQLRQAVQQVFHDPSLTLPLLYDCSHVSIKKEEWRGQEVWIHRHGASRALPPDRMQGHPVFSKTGQPLPIPGSMGDASYIGVADTGCEQAFYSVNHGAGRALDKPEASQHFTEEQVESELRNKHIRLYRYGTDNIAEQAPGSFKDITQVIEAMVATRLARPVVRLRPLAVLKG